MVLVIAVVVSATAIALAVGIATANTEFSATFRTVALGPIQLTVSDSGPSAGLVWLAGISIVIVALIALAFEGIAALLSARPRRKVLSARRHGRRMLPPAGPVRITVLVPAHNEEASLCATRCVRATWWRAGDRPGSSLQGSGCNRTHGCSRRGCSSR